MFIKQELTAIIIFALCGVIIWGICGNVATVSSFQPAPHFSAQPTKETIRQYVFIHVKGTVAWSLSGLAIGILLCLAYRTRPQHEHFTATYRLSPHAPGPKTVAELKVGFFGGIVGAVVGIALAVWLFPHLEIPDIAVVRPTFTRVLICVPIAVIAATVPTFTLSLWILTKIAEQRRW